MSDDIYRAVFKVAAALELPVVLLALVALAVVIYEAGAFAVEAAQRSRRRFPLLADAAAEARARVDAGETEAARAALVPVAWSRPMGEALTNIVGDLGVPNAEPRIAKRLADFDFACQSRLTRTRLLVRFGPALGLMGTLIPLSPALKGLADGDVTALTDNLRIAFSITVLGLLVGAVAFALSLLRDRLYGQDYSDLEYVAAILTDSAAATTGTPAAPPAPAAS
ncbi:MotA/TolQ/ExbB proton channel family protein [Nocardioides sp. BP30]|uniref:MotA/TolQ/ExbB proton channel family protein n=1 Tax=Nocardioides sp. BP30 TaxID=3036374 RepID=UPI0024697863|nr:MotA/TolQ/ExbB proton channel family protein [Nocardioides sp. BP30]WGL52163.1 MotA/TolQ/ExbB proton channel family protein [Nocardioides sp. BP30]